MGKRAAFTCLLCCRPELNFQICTLKGGFGDKWLQIFAELTRIKSSWNDRRVRRRCDYIHNERPILRRNASDAPITCRETRRGVLNLSELKGRSE